MPTIFEGCPKYLSKPQYSRKRPAIREPLIPSKMSKVDNNIRGLPADTLTDIFTTPPPTDQLGEISETKIEDENLRNGFPEIWVNPKLIPLPSTSWSFHQTELGDQKMIVYSEVRKCRNGMPEYYKQVILEPDYNIMKPKIVISNKIIDLQTVNEITSVNMTIDTPVHELLGSIIEKVNRQTVCCGGPTVKEFPSERVSLQSASTQMGTWRHNLCPIVLPNENDKQCLMCSGLEKTLNSKLAKKKSNSNGVRLRCPSTMSVKNKTGIQKLRKAIRLQRQARMRLQRRKKILETELQVCQFYLLIIV